MSTEKGYHDKGYNRAVNSTASTLDYQKELFEYL